MNLGHLSVEAARARMLAAVRPGAAETVALDAAAIGRVLAEPILARRDQPPFDASAMDGYALRIGDPGPAFTVVGESAAGHPHTDSIGFGQAVRVFTGALVPPGCGVVVQERARRQGDRVQVDTAPSAGQNVRPRAGDFSAGAVMLAAGMRLDPWRLALAAAAGRAYAAVCARPRVAILSTGEEIVKAERTDVDPSQVFDANGPALEALVAGWGGAPHRLDPAGDDEASILNALAGVEAELIVTIGGASVGDYDVVKPALTRLGLDITVESIRLRPGKPTWFGRLADGRCILGLPGNPASSLVAAELFLRPWLFAWQGADPRLPIRHARLTRALGETGPREHWMRAQLQEGADGARFAIPFSDQDSARVGVFAAADALLRRPAGAPPAEAGEVVDVLPLTRL